MYLFFDTETTGLPDYRLSLTDEAQPHIVQLAMILTDGIGKELFTFKAPIIPEGFEIDENGLAFAVNKISNDIANRYGVKLKTALSMFRFLEEKALMKIAHNYRFDGFLLKCAHERAGVQPIDPPIDKYCTMKAITEVMKLPATKRMQACGMEYAPKSARLSEGYEYCTGKKLENAHDALADVRACKEIFFWLVSSRLYKPQERTAPQAA